MKSLEYYYNLLLAYCRLYPDVLIPAAITHFASMPASAMSAVRLLGVLYPIKENVIKERAALPP